MAKKNHWHSKGVKKRERAISHGYSSGFEEEVMDKASGLGYSLEYEPFKIDYVIPEKKHYYTPDFELPNGIIIETKGRFLSEDRKKHILIKSQYPDKDIRFIFKNPNKRIRKGSDTTYADWCDKHGFLYAKREIPVDWFKEEI